MPHHLMASKSWGTARISAPSPSAASAMYIAFALRMPAMLACPERAPLTMLCPTTCITAGPGVMLSSVLVVTKAASQALLMPKSVRCAVVSMPCIVRRKDMSWMSGWMSVLDGGPGRISTGRHGLNRASR